MFARRCTSDRCLWKLEVVPSLMHACLAYVFPLRFVFKQRGLPGKYTESHFVPIFSSLHIPSLSHVFAWMLTFTQRHTYIRKHTRVPYHVVHVVVPIGKETRAQTLADIPGPNQHQAPVVLTKLFLHCSGQERELEKKRSQQSKLHLSIVCMRLNLLLYLFYLYLNYLKMSTRRQLKSNSSPVFCRHTVEPLHR
jgi:hypothetical protein